MYFLAHNDALQVFKYWKVLVENQTGKKIKRLRTYNGLKYLDKKSLPCARNQGS